MSTTSITRASRLAGLSAVAVAVLFASPAFALTEDQALAMVFDEPVQTTTGPAGRQSTPVPPVPSCVVPLHQVQDMRRNKATFGAVMFPQDEMFAHAAPMYAASIRSGDGVQWVQGAMKTMRRFGVDTPEAAGTPDAGAIDVALLLAHTWNGGMNMHSHVILEVLQPGKAGALPKRIHGFGTKANWGGTNAEYMTVLNSAMDNALQSLGKDLVARCLGKDL